MIASATEHDKMMAEIIQFTSTVVGIITDTTSSDVIGNVSRHNEGEGKLSIVDTCLTSVDSIFPKRKIYDRAGRVIAQR